MTLLNDFIDHKIEIPQLASVYAKSSENFDVEGPSSAPPTAGTGKERTNNSWIPTEGVGTRLPD